MRKQIFLAVANAIAEVPGVEYVDLWNNQVQMLNGGSTFPLNAVFIEFEAVEWKQQNMGARRGALAVRLHVITRAVVTHGFKDTHIDEALAVRPPRRYQRCHAGIEGRKLHRVHAHYLCNQPRPHRTYRKCGALRLRRAGHNRNAPHKGRFRAFSDTFRRRVIQYAPDGFSFRQGRIFRIGQTVWAGCLGRLPFPDSSRACLGRCDSIFQTPALSSGATLPCNISPDFRLHSVMLSALLSFLLALTYFYTAFFLTYASFLLSLHRPFTQGSALAFRCFGSTSAQLFYWAASLASSSSKSTSVMPRGMLRHELVPGSLHCARI